MAEQGVERGPGRPPTHDEPATAQVMVRLGPGEREQLRDAARQAGMTMSAWLRELVRERLGLGARKAKAPPPAQS